MDLDFRQTRELLVAGAVAFPTPFPSTGTIALRTSDLIYFPNERPKRKDLVIVHEYHPGTRIVRLMLQEDVSAIFVAGSRDDQGNFRTSHKPSVDDFDEGVWFLDSDVNEATVRQRLNVPHDDISSESSILRGIVFIPENRRILRIIESSHTAGADDQLLATCCTSR
jgi:hypothetical protein